MKVNRSGRKINQKSISATAGYSTMLPANINTSTGREDRFHIDLELGMVPRSDHARLPTRSQGNDIISTQLLETLCKAISAYGEEREGNISCIIESTGY